MTKTEKKLESLTKAELLDKLVEVGVVNKEKKPDFESLNNDTLVGIINYKLENDSKIESLKEEIKKSQEVKPAPPKDGEDADSVLPDPKSDDAIEKLKIENRRLKQQFAKFKKEIQGLISGFEKVMGSY